MRGISAHSNGFHTCRALHLLQLLLGAVDTPGSFRYQPPYPRPIPPANRPGKNRRADGSLDTGRSEEQTSELQSLMRISYAVFCLKKTKHINITENTQEQ